MKNTLWWIQKPNGKLATLGRSNIHGEIYESGPPKLFRTRRIALDHCNPGEKAVKVGIVKI